MQATLIAVVLASMAGVAIAQSCTTGELIEAEAIVNTCCEGVEGGCAEAFPATCGHTCAELVSPGLLTQQGDQGAARPPCILLEAPCGPSTRKLPPTSHYIRMRPKGS
jgi:hypothetical protein